MYLTDIDYESHQATKNLNILTKNDTLSVRDFAEAAAEEQMRSYLANRFDISVIFAQTTTDRNPLLVMYLVDMSVYHMFAKIPNRQTPEDVGLRFEEAINWLKDVAKGKNTPTLPLREISETVPADMQYGSEARINLR